MKAELSENQARIADMLCDMIPQVEIARDLGISPARVSQQIRKIKDFYGVEELPELIAAHRRDRIDGRASPPIDPPAEEKVLRVLPAAFDGPKAVRLRLAAIFGCAFLIAGLLAILAEFSNRLAAFFG